MKKNIIAIIVVLAQMAAAQVENLSPSATFDAPEFFFDALSFSSGDSLQSRVDLYIQVPYDALQFVKSGNGFTARYEVTMNFIGGDKSSVSEKLWTEEVKSTEYSTTESRKSTSVTQRSVQLAPGVYTPIEQVMDEVMRLVDKGVKEVIVIGQDTTYYGLDVYGERKIASLLTSLASIKELEWIRLMYAYPAKFPLDVLQSYRDNPKICRYIDMPIQHAADNVLKSMRRGITRRSMEDLIGKIRDTVPNIALRTTLITGYPNETEKDVLELAQFMNDVKFDRLGVFTYSQEDDTTAFDLGDPIPEQEKERRKEFLMETQRKISLEKNESRIGMETRAVIERIEDGNYVGRTEWDAPEIDNEVFISIDEQSHRHIGDFVNVTITDATEYDLYAEVKTQNA